MAITAQYWRLTILANASGLTKALTEVAFLGVGGTDLSVGGLAFASRESGGNVAANAFDKDTGTLWATPSSLAVDHIGYDHGAPVSVDGVRISWGGNPNQLPLNGTQSLRLQYSDDGVNYSRVMLLTLTSGDFTINTTAEFDINDLSAMVAETVGGFVFVSSPTAEQGLTTVFTPDGVQPYHDFEFGGFGRVAGTVKEDGSPDVPVKRRVRLHREQDGLLIREVWSDPVTGEYSFDGISQDYKYYVVAFDYTETYTAVIKDNETPEAMA